jgi:hypothetical protein
MTIESKSFLKEWVTVANLIILIGIVVQQARWQQTVDSQLVRMEEHINDKVEHLPFEDRIRLFVPRVEIDGRLRNIEEALIEIKDDLKKNLNK